MNETNMNTIQEGTRRQALYLWIGLSLSLTLFFVQSQMFYVSANPLPSSKLEWIFTILGIITFLLGHFFFKNYMTLRKPQLAKASEKDKKQTVLMAFVMQFVLFETLGLYGVLLSVLRQNTLKAVPFILFAYIGFALSFPKREKIKPYFE